MAEPNWIEIEDQSSDASESWIGTVQRSVDTQISWYFNLLHTKSTFYDLEDTKLQGRYSIASNFESGAAGTLILPHISDFRTWSNFGGNKNHRTEIKGQAFGLLTDLGINDESEPIFSRIEFECDPFAIWFDWIDGVVKSDLEGGLEPIEVARLGNIRISKQNSAKFGRNAVTHSQTYCVSIDFDRNRNLKEVVEIAPTFSLLFGFLLGIRQKFPEYKVYISDDISKYRNKIGVLEIGYERFIEDVDINQFTAVHLRRVDNSDLGTILKRYYEKLEKFRNVIHCVEHVRFFSNNVDDNFRTLVPRLEMHLSADFVSEQDQNYAAEKKKFEKFVRDSGRTDVIKFFEQYVRSEPKKISLPEMIGKKIEHLNSKGAQIDVNFAKRIQGRRGRLFHREPNIKSDDILSIYDEVCVGAAILMLSAFDDLGISISTLENRRNTLSDLRRLCFPHRQIDFRGVSP